MNSQAKGESGEGVRSLVGKDIPHSQPAKVLVRDKRELFKELREVKLDGD